jgi:hypothetical protein
MTALDEQTIVGIRCVASGEPCPVLARVLGELGDRAMFHERRLEQLEDRMHVQDRRADARGSRLVAFQWLRGTFLRGRREPYFTILECR